MTSGSRFMNTYLNSSGVNVILAQSCRCSMMSSTSPVGSSQHAIRGMEAQSTVEVDLSIKVRVVEDLHGNFFLSTIESLEFIVLDGDVHQQMWRNLARPCKAIIGSLGSTRSRDTLAGNTLSGKVLLGPTRNMSSWPGCTESLYLARPCQALQDLVSVGIFDWAVQLARSY